MIVGVRHWLEYVGLALGFRATAALPLGMLRPLAHVLGAVAWSVDGRGRSVSLANLEAAFPGRYSLTEKRRVGRSSYQTFARTMLELAWAPNLNEEILGRLVEAVGLEGSPCHSDPQRAAIYSTFHYSNFEWLSLAGRFTISRMPIVAQEFKNPRLGPLFDDLRSRTGHPLFPRSRVMLKLLRHLREGGKFGFLVDLSLDPRQGSVCIEQFGGLKTSVTQMHAALALKTGAAIVPLICRPLPDGRYRIVYHPQMDVPAGTPPREIAQMTWDAVEPVLRENPEHWLWAYKHWRFKPSNGDTSRYPFYSNTTDRFDRILT